MRVVILGSGTLLPHAARRSPAHLVEGAGFRVLLDCGSGALHGLSREGGVWRELDAVVLSHFHTDHVGDLAPLLFALRHGLPGGRAAPLRLLGPPGLEAFLGALAQAHGGFVRDPGFPLEVVELEPGKGWEGPGFAVETHPTPHTAASVAVRLDTPEGSVGYTGDTGPDPFLGAFLRGVRLLLVECSQPDPPALEGHLSPSGVAALAGEVRPELVVTTHVYPPLVPEEVPDLVRVWGYEGDVRAGVDGMVLLLEGGGIRVVEPGEGVDEGGTVG